MECPKRRERSPSPGCIEPPPGSRGLDTHGHDGSMPDGARGRFSSLRDDTASCILRPVERATKSTFLLSDSRRARLKAIGVEQRKTVTELLAEGADLVIQKYQGVADRDELLRRAAGARVRMRKGLFKGPSLSDAVDSIVYPKRRRKR